MMDIKVDLLKNRLYITYSPYPENSRENGFQAITKATEKLAPGFTCITRITDIRHIDHKIMQFVRQATQLLVDQGMACAVRIGDFSGNNTAGEKNGAPRIKNGDAPYKCPISTADTLEKAEIILDQWENAGKYKPSETAS